MLEKLQREYQIASTRAYQQREKITKIEKDLDYEKIILADLERHMGVLQESITGKENNHATENNTKESEERRETGNYQQEYKDGNEVRQTTKTSGGDCFR